MFIDALFYLTFIFFSLGQIGRISLFGGQVNFYLYEVFMVVLFSYLFFKYRLTPVSLFIKKLKIFFIFVLLMLFSFLINFPKYNFGENIIAFLYFLRLVFYFVYYFYLSYWVNNLDSRLPTSSFGLRGTSRGNDKDDKKTNLLKGVILFITITIISSLLQYFFYPDLRNLLYLGWDPHLYRMFGLFFDTSVSGTIYGLIFFFVLSVKNKRQVKKLILLGIFLVFIVLTFSRSVYLGFLITVPFILLKNNKWRELLIIGGLFGLLIFIVPKPSGEGVNLIRVFSINSRLENYKQAIDLWQKNWFFGIGYNHIRYGRDSFRIGNAGASYHSSFLIVLVTGGILGLLGWLGLLVGLIKQNKKIASIILFLSILSLFDNVLLHPFVLFLALSIIPLLSR